MATQTGDYETYYVPEQSKLPILASIGLATTVFGAASVLNDMKAGVENSSAHWILLVGFAIFATVLWNWFKTTINENLQGMNSAQLKKSYSIGMIWFIFSEVMFFFAFFLALFYVRNLAGPWLAGEGDRDVTNLLWPGFTYEWPMLTTPQDAVNAAGGSQVPAVTGEFEGAEHAMSWPGFAKMFTWLPLWNTIILLSSSFTVHVAHLALKANNRPKMKLWLGITVALGILFVVLQGVEYYEAYAHMGLTLDAGIYGSTFFMLTGFHGFHVCLGAFILLVMWLRSVSRDHFTPEDHFGFEAASWYWHFVDVVWVCLFLFVYII